eukprot:s313_g41.t1
MSGAAQSAAGHADVPPGPSGAPSKFVPATPDPFQPPPGAFYPEEFKRQAAEFNRDCASPVTGPWKAAPEVPPLAIRTANYDPRDDPWSAEDGPLELNPCNPFGSEAGFGALWKRTSTAGNSEPAAMTDASKRRGEGVDRAELLDEWEEFSVVSETEDSPPWFPNYPAGLPSTFKWGPSWEESDVLVDLDKVDLAIPKPAWVHSTEQWSRTIITMPKYRAQKITFLEFTKMVFRRDPDAAKYAKKLIGKYRKMVTACPRSQAPDLAAWCLHVRLDAFLDAGKSYKREFADPEGQ